MADRFERQNQWPGTQQQCVGAVVSTVVLRPHVKHVKIKVQVLVPRPSWPTKTGQERACIMQTDPSFVRLFRGRKYRIDCRNAALKKRKNLWLQKVQHLYAATIDLTKHLLHLQPNWMGSHMGHMKMASRVCRWFNSWPLPWLWFITLLKLKGNLLHLLAKYGVRGRARCQAVLVQVYNILSPRSDKLLHFPNKYQSFSASQSAPNFAKIKYPQSHNLSPHRCIASRRMAHTDRRHPWGGICFIRNTGKRRSFAYHRQQSQRASIFGCRQLCWKWNKSLASRKRCAAAQ